jgi:hypothetical protein
MTMRALKKLSGLDKNKLKALQLEVNSLRPGFLDDKTLAEWLSLTIKEREMKIHVRLSMARLSATEMEGIYQRISPWWEPYRKGFMAFLLLAGIYLMVQVAGFKLAERVYLTDLTHELAYSDGTSDTYDLFDRNTMILRTSGEDSVYLQEDQLMGWLTGAARTAVYDRFFWTEDEELSDQMKRFFSSFEGKPDPIRKLQGYSLEPVQIYKAVEGYLGRTDGRMDIDLPENYRSTHLPFYEAPDAALMIRSFFCTIREGEVFKNLKIDFNDQGLQAVRPVYYPPRNVWEQQKLIWNSEPTILVPIFRVLDANGTIGKQYIIPLADSIARQTN